MNMNEEKHKQIKQFFKKEPVEVVYLFGSQAKGRIGPMSDFDFGILFDSTLTADRRFKKRLQYIGYFSKLFQTDALDVVDLFEAPVFLKYEVVKHKKLLYVKSEATIMQFEKQAIDDYLDRLYYIKRHTVLGLEKLQKEYAITT